MIASIVLSAFLLFQTPTISPQPTVSPTPSSVPTNTNSRTPPSPTPTASIAQLLEEPDSVTKHSVNAGGRTLNYTVRAGYMPIRNAQTGETEAKIFYMAYTLDGAPGSSARRPLMFSFNGGPGSASVWLHLGALGPKRVRMLDNGLMPPPPYELVDNEATWLDQTDMVFIDTVGTGYSRALKPEVASKFFSLNGDIESVGEFIRMYLSKSERWSSPLFLVGESYGTTRASGLSNYLFEHGVGLNGILLISTVMNFQTIRFADGNDTALAMIVPSYTATAWYHKRLAPALQNKPLRDVLREAENWVLSEYSSALVKSDRLTAAERQAVIDKYSYYTGLNKTYVDQNDFRIELDQFNKELLRDQRRSTGRLDSRFTGIDKNAGGDSPDMDPSMSAIRPPYTATFNDYVRRELGFKSDLEYYILGGGIGRWDYNQNNGYANTSVALRSAMMKNPYMKLFVACGYYDMATPYFAAEYSLAAMNLDPSLRRNVTVNYYEAGHMMYIDKVSLKKLKEDVATFIQKSIQK